MSDGIDLFTPLALGGRTLPNRVFMSPMTRLRAAADGTPTPLMAEHYAQRASAGQIVTEGTFPHPSARGYAGQPGIADEAHVAGWRAVTDAVHRAGWRIVLQVHHSGRISHPDLLGGELPVAPSAVAAKGEIHLPGGKKPYPLPRSLSAGEIPSVIDHFRAATERAARAGFDGVELHGANGYLPHQFLSNRINTRTDEYGGSVENRARFTLDALRAMVAVRGPAFVGVKVNVGPFAQHDIAVDDEQEVFPYLAKQLDALKLGYVHVQRPITDWGMDPVPYDPFGLFRPHYRGVLVGGGAFGYDSATEAVQAGRVDAATFGRHFLANPDLPARFRRGAPLTPADPATFYSPGPKGYTDYPVL